MENRSYKMKGLTSKYLGKQVFQEIVSGIDEAAILKSWSAVEWEKSSGFATEVISAKTKHSSRMLGLFRYHLEYTKGNEICSKDIILKSKPTGAETIETFISMISESNVDFAKEFEKYASKLEIGTLERRELECVNLKDKVLHSIMPDIYWSKFEDENDIYVFAMEFLDPNKFTHIDTINNTTVWQEEEIIGVLRGLSLFHSQFYEKNTEFPASSITTYKKSIFELMPLWKTCLHENFTQQGSIWSKDCYELGHEVLRSLSYICDYLDSLPKTLLHHDVTLMNLCLRKDKDDKQRVCIYDWENCSVGIPQNDLATFLIFLLPENTDIAKWDHYVKLYLRCLQENLADKAGKTIEEVHQQKEELHEEEFIKAFAMCLCIILIGRCNWANAVFNPKFKPSFGPRVLNNCITYIEHAKQIYHFLH